MSWGMVAVAAATVVKGVMDNKSAKNAADAQADGANAGIAEQRRQFDQMRQDSMPYMEGGQRGLNGLFSLMQGDEQPFLNSSWFKFGRDQMIDGLDASAASRGRLNAGGYDTELAQNINGYASQNVGQYTSMLQHLAGLGQASAAGVGAAGMNMAGNIQRGYQNAGDARAQGAINQANAFGSMFNGLGGLASQYFGQGGGGGGGFGGPTDAMQQAGSGGAWG